MKTSTGDKVGAGHTPTPWVGRKAKKHFVIEAANGVRVATIRFIGRPDGSTSEDVMMLIVQACNAHDDLVEAANMAIGFVTVTDPGNPILAKFRSALAKAEGGAR
jgi:hypothetical protein